jgi:hypothetical protein
MNTCHPHTLINGNPVRLYHTCEPCSASFFFELAPIDNSLRWVFFQDHCMSFIGLVLCGLQVHTPRPCSNFERDHVPVLHLQKEPFITLSPCRTPLWALIPFIGAAEALIPLCWDHNLVLHELRNSTNNLINHQNINHTQHRFKWTILSP